MSLTKIGKEAAQQSGSSSGGDGDVEYERIDVSGDVFVKQHPTTAVAGNPVALRYFTGDPDNGGYDRGYTGLILENPTLVTDDEGLEGTTVFSNSGDTGDDYKVVNIDDSETKELGEGVDFDGNVFYGDAVEAFDEDRIILKLTGNAGRSAACTLDVHGKGGADVERDDEGEPVLNDNGSLTENGALIEYAPDNDDDNYTPPRFARDTQLRPDVEDHEVAVMVQRLSEVKDDYDGDSYWVTVMERADEDDEWTELEPTDEYEPDEDVMRATNWLEWHFPDSETIERLQDEQDS